MCGKIRDAVSRQEWPPDRPEATEVFLRRVHPAHDHESADAHVVQSTTDLVAKASAFESLPKSDFRSKGANVVR